MDPLMTKHRSLMREEKRMSGEIAEKLEQKLTENSAEDRTYLDALNAQFETFCGLDKVRDLLDPAGYSLVRAAVVSGRDIRAWRRYSAAASVLAKGGMAAADIASYGLPMIEGLSKSTVFANEEDVALTIASVATEFGLAGADLPRVEALITFTVKALQGGF